MKPTDVTENATATETAAEPMPRTEDLPRLLPRVDTLEREHAFELVVDLPGADEDRVDIKVEDDVLTLTAPLVLEEPAGLPRLHLERGAGVWERSFTLSVDIDKDHIEADLRHGVLRLTLPKVRPAVRRIPIQSR